MTWGREPGWGSFDRLWRQMLEIKQKIKRVVFMPRSDSYLLLEQLDAVRKQRVAVGASSHKAAQKYR